MTSCRARYVKMDLVEGHFTALYAAIGEIDRLREALEAARREHGEGNAFAMPGCNLLDERLRARGCNCGTAEHNAAISAALAIPAEEEG